MLKKRVGNRLFRGMKTVLQVIKIFRSTEDILGKQKKNELKFSHMCAGCVKGIILNFFSVYKCF